MQPCCSDDRMCMTTWVGAQQATFVCHAVEYLCDKAERAGWSVVRGGVFDGRSAVWFHAGGLCDDAVVPVIVRRDALPSLVDAPTPGIGAYRGLWFVNKTLALTRKCLPTASTLRGLLCVAREMTDVAVSWDAAAHGPLECAVLGRCVRGMIPVNQRFDYTDLLMCPQTINRVLCSGVDPPFPASPTSTTAPDVPAPPAPSDCVPDDPHCCFGMRIRRVNANRFDRFPYCDMFECVYMVSVLVASDAEPDSDRTRHFSTASLTTEGERAMLEDAIGYMMCVEGTESCPRRVCVTWSSSDQHAWRRAIDRHPPLARFRTLVWFGLRERVYVPCGLKQRYALPDLKLVTAKGHAPSTRGLEESEEEGDGGFANIGVMWCEEQRARRGLTSIGEVAPAMLRRVAAAAADDCVWLLRRLVALRQ